MNTIKILLGGLCLTLGGMFLMNAGYQSGQNYIGNAVVVCAAKWPDKTLSEFAKEACEEGFDD